MALAREADPSKANCTVCSNLRAYNSTLLGFDKSYGMITQAAATRCELCGLLQHVNEFAHVGNDGEPLHINEEVQVHVRPHDNDGPVYASLDWQHTEQYRKQSGAPIKTFLMHLVPGKLSSVLYESTEEIAHSTPGYTSP